MPSEHLPPPPLPLQQDFATAQVKHCSYCSNPLTADADLSAIILLNEHDSNDHLMICRPCRDRLLPSAPYQPSQDRLLYPDVQDDAPMRLASTHGSNEAAPLPIPPSTLADRSALEDHEMDLSPSLAQPSTPQQYARPFSTATAQDIPSASSSSKPAALTIDCNAAASSSLLPLPSSSPRISSRFPTASSPRTASHRPAPTPDPFVDITRIRMRSQGHHCLYPGATFQGTQKSGRNSYDVTVTIVVRTCVLRSTASRP
ncbi:hypothetical protein BV25DRAFT_261699 [Artomyces pyxidatus]|uniref:Uncharacterized protein n=1 Tax=Artomyces pyxidatus TaxID=48021 RepID=A0ACB8T6T5_9AGAM|nr:hypothetical protein BV25DRAFT_261699 [Artomyces pyxidatus]